MCSSLISCKRIEIQRGLKGMISKEIVMPILLEKVQTDTVVSCTLDACSKFIIYIDSTECSSCRIGHLPQYYDLFAFSKRNPSFDFTIIISPKRKEREQVVRQLQLSSVFPVYLEKGESLLSLNPFIPHDNRFHCILTDLQGKVTFVGDPTWGDKTKTLFYKALSQIRIPVTNSKDPNKVK